MTKLKGLEIPPSGALRPLPHAPGQRLGKHANIVNTLAEEIIAGKFPPGTRLPGEAELITQFSASSTSIREAVRVLASKGLVVPRRRTGVLVAAQHYWRLLDSDVIAWHARAGLSMQFVADLMELREIIEPAAARLAAQRRTDADLKMMTEAFRRMVLAKKDAEAYHQADVDFHISIFKSTHNEMVRQLAEVAETVLDVSFRFQSRSPLYDPDTGIPLHEAILETIARREPEEAERRMRGLVADARREVTLIPLREPQRASEGNRDR